MNSQEVIFVASVISGTPLATQTIPVGGYDTIVVIFNNGNGNVTDVLSIQIETETIDLVNHQFGTGGAQVLSFGENTSFLSGTTSFLVNGMMHFPIVPDNLFIGIPAIAANSTVWVFGRRRIP